VDNNQLVIKKPKFDNERTEEYKKKAIESWEAECKRMRSLQHPNVVQVLEVPDEIVKSDGFPVPVMAMELCSGNLRTVSY
jgi:serine/threonine protein kinase